MDKMTCLCNGCGKYVTVATRVYCGKCNDVYHLNCALVFVKNEGIDICTKCITKSAAAEVINGLDINDNTLNNNSTINIPILQTADSTNSVTVNDAMEAQFAHLTSSAKCSLSLCKVLSTEEPKFKCNYCDVHYHTQCARNLDCDVTISANIIRASNVFCAQTKLQLIISILQIQGLVTF